MGGCQTEKEMFLILITSAWNILGELNSLETILGSIDITMAIEPQQKQLQNGEQVSFSCGLTGLLDISDFCKSAVLSVQISVHGIEHSKKMYVLNMKQNNFIGTKI